MLIWLYEEGEELWWFELWEEGAVAVLASTLIDIHPGTIYFFGGFAPTEVEV